MAGRNRGSFIPALTFIFCASMLLAGSAQAKKNLKAGATCELQENITVRNKAQRKNVKTRKLGKGSTFKIVRYHRVWVRIQTSDGIAFATPKSIRTHCVSPQPVAGKTGNPEQVATPTPPATAQAPAGQSSAPETEPKSQSAAAPSKTEPAETKPDSEPVPAAAPTPPLTRTSELAVQAVQVPKLIPRVERRTREISPAAWVALGAGAAGIGASAYFVSQLTTQDEAPTGQAALLAGTAGIIGVIIGLSYVLSPEERILAPSESQKSEISTAISVGPGSITVSGKF